MKWNTRPNSEALTALKCPRRNVRSLAERALFHFLPMQVTLFAMCREWPESYIASEGLTIFARIDFSGDAGKSGLSMNPTRLLIFGNPKAGTPIMLAGPSLAIDFPLKIHVPEDDAGKAWVSYNSPEYL
ncbi:MAG: DUF302 domain-containing protein [archaeon]|nr:DUF302 domain-containing protein [archaeon]